MTDTTGEGVLGFDHDTGYMGVEGLVGWTVDDRLIGLIKAPYEGYDRWHLQLLLKDDHSEEGHRRVTIASGPEPEDRTSFATLDEAKEWILAAHGSGMHDRTDLARIPPDPAVAPKTPAIRSWRLAPSEPTSRMISRTVRETESRDGRRDLWTAMMLAAPAPERDDPIVETIARALAQRYIDRGNARVTGATHSSWEEMPGSYTRDFMDDARAVLKAITTI